MSMETDQEGKFGVLLKQGAEATVFESDFLGRRSIVNQRFSKKYRHPSLDVKLTLKRLNAEARCMTKARRLGVQTPTLYAVDAELRTLTFEFMEGLAVKDLLLGLSSKGIVQEQLDDVATQIGSYIGKLHDGGLVHGDLTTSNMIIQEGTNQLVLIDFGLSFISTLPEDKSSGSICSRKSIDFHALFLWQSDGSYSHGLQEIFKNMVRHFEQAS